MVFSTREDVPFLGATIDEIREGAPTAYAERVARGGTLNAIDDPRFVDAVQATGRPTIIAGVLTDVYFWP